MMQRDVYAQLLSNIKLFVFRLLTFNMTLFINSSLTLFTFFIFIIYHMVLDDDVQLCVFMFYGTGVVPLLCEGRS